MAFARISDHLYRFTDTCNVYLVMGSESSILVDFGSGAILDHLQEIHASSVTDILVTHHHRDQVQGLANPDYAGLRIWAPYNEQDLIGSIDTHWQAREIFNNYNVRQDRFSLLNPVKLAGLLEDYATFIFGGVQFEVIPTPGHTTGSISLAAEIDGQKVVFSGDLIYGPGKLWSLAATQWSYNGGEGLPATVASLVDLKSHWPDLLLPSHGEPIAGVAEAIDLTINRLQELMGYRQQNPRLLKFIEDPYSPVTPHLLRSNQNMANTYVLLSASHKALLIDFGYDFMTGVAPGADRASRRPWLYGIHRLKKKYNVEKIDVVIPTHYHDDHVAGINLLRRAEGTRSWVPESFSAILANPARHNLPCLWYDPIPADRELGLERPVAWEEYTLTLYPLPGHTRYAVAINFTVDGHKALAVGDQFQNDDGRSWNYVYQNRFEAGDYRETADLYSRLQPDLVLSGHWEPMWVKPGYIAELQQRGAALERMHQNLLPEEIAGFGAEGFGARIEPYQSFLHTGETLDLEVEVKNPSAKPDTAILQIVLPAGWTSEPSSRRIDLAPMETHRTTFHVIPASGQLVRRARLAVDLTVGAHPFGQQAEALVTIM